MWLILILFAPLFFFLFMELKYYKIKQLMSRLPGPTPIPVLGNAHQMSNNPSEILEILFKWWHQFNQSNYHVWIGYFSNIVVTNVKDIEFILTSNTLLEKSDVYEMTHPWLGTGLLTSHGTKWHKHRKMITPSFHFQILQVFHEVMNANSTKFIEKLRQASVGETIFDVQEMVHYFTLDVICETAMGVNINAMDNTDSEVVAAFKEICQNINVRAFHPIKRNPTLYRFMPEYAQFQKTLKVLQDFTNDIIQKRMEARQNSAKNPPKDADDTESDVYTRSKLAFLDTLLSATIDGRPLTQYEVYEECSTFMFEGHDTTTSGISFAIYMLSRHPEIQKKVFEEQKQIMGSHLHRDATFQELADMKYLDLVIKEAQRLYPSVPFVARRAEKEYNMHGTIVPKGTSINLFIMALGYNEKTFPDPYCCQPERFDTENQTEKLNPFAYVPFSAGPRNCIGQKFALLELKTVISKVVRTFEILPPLDELVSKDGYVQNFPGLPEKQRSRPNPSKYDPILSAVLTLKSENGIQIRLRERK